MWAMVPKHLGTALHYATRICKPEGEFAGIPSLNEWRQQRRLKPQLKRPSSKASDSIESIKTCILVRTVLLGLGLVTVYSITVDVDRPCVIVRGRSRECRRPCYRTRAAEAGDWRCTLGRADGVIKRSGHNNDPGSEMAGGNLCDYRRMQLAEASQLLPLLRRAVPSFRFEEERVTRAVHVDSSYHYRSATQLRDRRARRARGRTTACLSHVRQRVQLAAEESFHGDRHQHCCAQEQAARKGLLGRGGAAHLHDHATVRGRRSCPETETERWSGVTNVA